MDFVRRMNVLVAVALCACLVSSTGCDLDWLLDWLQPSDDGQTEIVAGLVEGYVELTERRVGSSAWDDPESPIITYAEQTGHHRPGQDLLGSGVARVFMLLGEVGHLGGVYSFEPNANAVYVEAPHSFAALDQTAEVVNGEGRLWEGTNERSAGPLVVTLETSLATGCANDEVPCVEVSMAYTYLVAEAIPADEQTGRPAIEAGSTVTWTGTATFRATASPGPFAELSAADFLHRQEYCEPLLPDTPDEPNDEPNLPIEEPNDPEPNEEEPARQTPASYVELTSRQIGSAGWDNPDSDLIAFAHDAGYHMPGEDMFGEGVGMAFLMFDSTQRLAGAYSHDADANTVFVEALHSFAALGAGIDAQPDGTPFWQGACQRTPSPLSVSADASLSLSRSDDGTMTVELVMTYVYTVTEPIPADAESGRGALAVGTTVTWTGTATFTGSGSPGPYVTLSDATFRQRDAYDAPEAPEEEPIEEPEEEGIDGYWELADRQISSSGWDAPDSDVVAYVQDAGYHMPGEDVFGDDVQRAFVLFDDAKRLSSVFSYDAEQDIVFVEGPHSFAALGAVAEAQQDGAQLFSGTASRTADPLSISVETSLSLMTLQDGSMTAEVTTTYTYEVTEAIPADEEAGWDAIEAGSSATWTGTATFTVADSDGPYEELAEATFRQRDAYDAPEAPEESAAPALAGTWEIIPTDDEPEAEWEDPQAPLALYIEENGNPFADNSDPNEEEEDDSREFVVIDPNDRMVGYYVYEPEDDTVYISTPQGMPLLGEVLISDGDGAFHFEPVLTHEGDFGSEVAYAGWMTVFVTLGEDGKSADVRATNTVLVTATQDIPADPNTGRPAIQAGDQVAYSSVDSQELALSPGPAVLYPDSEWALNPDCLFGALPSGFYEITGPMEMSFSWSDPNSAILQYLEEEAGGVPVSEEPLIIEENDRVFILFDGSGTFAMVYDYYTDEDLLEIDGHPGHNPFVGETPQLTEDGNGWEYQAEFPTQENGTVAIAVDFFFTVHHGDPDNGQYLTVQMIMTVSVLQDIDANPGTNRPAIPAGSSVTWTQDETYVIRSSESPYELFPDADVEVVEPDDGDSEPPEGYYELTDPYDTYQGWDDPETPFALLIGEDSLPTGLLAEVERSFVLFDLAGTFVQGYDYDKDENTVTVDSVEDNFLIGVAPQEHGGDTWEWQVGLSFGNEGLLVELSASLWMYGGEDDEGRECAIHLQLVYTALADIPEDPGAGRPEIPEGTRATYQLLEYYTATSSEGPFALFPDAEFQDGVD